MMNNKKEISGLRTAVVGTGVMGQNHARIYNEVSNLICVCDVNEKSGREVAENYGVGYYNDYRQMPEAIDALTISVPTRMHKEIAEYFIDKGINLLIEKPLSDNLNDANKIVDLSNSKGIKLAVGHIERHNPVVRKAKEKLDSGQWGDIVTMSSRRLSSLPERIKDVGVLYDLLIHDVDVMRYLAQSEVKSLLAFGGSRINIDFEDHVNMLLQFENNQLSICEGNWLTPMKVRELAITTTDHHIKLDYLKQKILVSSSSFGKIKSSNLYSTQIHFDREEINLDQEEPLMNEIIDFLNCIIYDTEPLVSGKDGIEAVNIIQKGLASLKSKKVQIF